MKSSSSALLSVAEAQARLLAAAIPVAIEEVPIADAAGRWAATDIRARRTQPAADLSSMDGYAIRFADLPGPWRLVGESAAGRPLGVAVGPGEAARIFTGAALPTGADTILVQEEALADGATIRLVGEGPPCLGSSVRPRGLDFAEGDVLIAKGERLTPARLALAAIAGHGALSVHRRVRIAIAATGDELVAPGDALAPGQIPESNSLMLRGLLAGLPIELVDLGIIPDRLDMLTGAFAGTDADILVTSGGASVGDHDLVRPAIEAVGGSVEFWRVAMRPGKPVLAGKLGDAVLLGLPGNPVSAFVTATLFLRPLVAALSGAHDPLLSPTTATLGEPLAANDGRQDYLRAALRGGTVHPLGLQDSSMLRTLARADCLIVRPAHAPPAHAGEPVEILSIA